MTKSVGRFFLALMLCLAAPTVYSEESANHVQNVRVAILDSNEAAKVGAPQIAGLTEVVIETAAAAQYTAKMASGQLEVNLSSTDTATAIAPVTDTKGLVSGVLTQTSTTGGKSLTRVTINTTSATTNYRIHQDGKLLRVWFYPDGKEDSTAKKVSKFQKISFKHDAESDRVIVRVSGPVRFSSVPKEPTKARIEIESTSIVKDQEKTLDVTDFHGKISNVSVFHKSGADNVLVLEADKAVDATAEAQIRETEDGSELVWVFRAGGEKSVVPAGEQPKVKEKEAKTEEQQASGFLSEFPMQIGNGNYTGRKIDLDFKDADIHSLLRLLADVGKVNIVAGDDVTGSVTIKMHAVPWDLALEVILQAKGLGMVRNGNLIRVAKADALAKERELALAKVKTELELAELQTRLIPISYANAADLAQKAQSLKSTRGTIITDERTNVLIVRDVAGNIDSIERLVRTLDTQTPEVLIEARIVEATSNYLRDVGIQWGGDATASAATGNPTGLYFPNRVGVVGGASDSNTPTSGMSPTASSISNPNFAVNLPATVGTGTGGAIGFTLGSIDNILNLNVRLSASEQSGMVRIISSPRILTLDNREASIGQGTLIPFLTASAQGTQTTFQEAKLSLTVKPHVTADGSIAMHVKITRDEPDYTNTSANGAPSILKRNAETDLLVPDNATVVFGGIYTRNTGRTVNQVPFFGDIPILGLLFQRRRASDTRTELVVFLTPRIVNRSEALGH